MKSIDRKIKEIIDNFSFFDEWEERYQYLIDIGKKLPTYPDEYKKDQFLVQGCTSNLWLILSLKGEKLIMRGDSDSVIVKGLFYILFYIYNDEKKSTILNTPPIFLDKIGLRQHLGPSRSNGLSNLIRYIENYCKKS